MQRLGGADAVEDLEAVLLLDAVEHPRGQRLARRDAVAHGRERLPRQVGRDQRAPEARAAEEQGDAVLDDPLGEERRGRAATAPAPRSRPPTAGTAGCCRGRRRRTAWRPRGRRRRGRCRAPGGRRSRRRSGCRRGGASRPWGCRWCPRCRATARATRPRTRRARPAARRRAAPSQVRPVTPGDDGCGVAGEHDVAQVRGARGRRRHRVGELVAAQQHPGAGVDDELAQLAAGQHRRARHGHRAEVHRGQDAGGQLDVVGHAQQHPLLRAYPDRGESARHPADVVGELSVGVGPARVTQRHPVGVARGDPAFREVRGGVEGFRHRALRCSAGYSDTTPSWRCVNGT